MVANISDAQLDDKKILLALLDIIDFSQDREVYTEQFFQNCQKQAFLDIFNKMPFDKRQHITGLLGKEENEERKRDLLLQYISEKEYIDSLKSVSQAAFTKLIETLTPTLSTEQLTKLQLFFQEIPMQKASIFSSK
jgi:hypothetical protein